MRENPLEPILHEGLHMWLTEEMGFIFDEKEDRYIRPKKNGGKVVVGAGLIRMAADDQADPRDIRNAVMEQVVKP